MFAAKTINYTDNVVFVVHALPKNQCEQNWPHLDLSPLNNLGTVVAVTNKYFPIPQELSPAEGVQSWLGVIQRKKLRTDLFGKNLYFTGGNFFCCLSNAVKSFYALPGIFQKDMSFFLITDYVWCFKSEQPTAARLGAFPYTTYENTAAAFLHAQPDAGLLENLFNISPVRKHKVNITIHYQDKKTARYANSVLYAAAKNPHTINLVVCPMRDIRRYGGAQNIPLE